MTDALPHAPCLHFSGVAPSRCLIGRDAPRDCNAGCAAYDDGAGLTDPSALDESERTRCEIWTRVMGYHRPVSAFNAGKQAEHAERRLFIEGDHG